MITVINVSTNVRHTPSLRQTTYRVASTAFDGRPVRFALSAAVCWSRFSMGFLVMAQTVVRKR
jgi:hypothetical protein